MNFELRPRSLTQSGGPIYYRGRQPRLLPQPIPNQQGTDDRPFAERLTTEELAWHEAGHAVAQVALGKQLWGVAINPETGAGNCFAVDPSKKRDVNSERHSYETICRGWQRADSRPSKSWVGDEIVCLLAGPIAQVQNIRSHRLMAGSMICARSTFWPIFSAVRRANSKGMSLIGPSPFVVSIATPSRGLPKDWLSSVNCPATMSATCSIWAEPV
jgi:hypothetical protein